MLPRFTGLILSATALVAQEPADITLLAANRVFEGVGFERGNSLWLSLELLPAVTGFESKPEGLCLADLCIPLPADGSWIKARGEVQYLNLSAFADHLDQVLLKGRDHNVWSLGRAPIVRGRGLGAGLAPDFELQDRQGRPVRLSDFRGKKVLLLTWASW